jgi:hypothetical protein
MFSRYFASIDSLSVNRISRYVFVQAVVVMPVKTKFIQLFASIHILSDGSILRTVLCESNFTYIGNRECGVRIISAVKIAP